MRRDYQRRQQPSSKRVRRNQNTTSFTNASIKHVGPISSLLLVGTLVTIASLLYLVQITKTSVYGFEVSELKNQQTELVQRNETLRVEAARLQSLNRVESSELASEFAPASELSFLDN